MRVRDLHDHLRSLEDGWVDWEDTVDGVIAGDPDDAVEAVAVGWMPYRETLERAAERGCDVFVTHEPTFYHHHDDPDLTGGPEVLAERVAAKERLLEELDIAIYRCHDVWDRYPGIGVPDAWGRRLEFEERVDGEGYYRVYDVGERTARGVARDVAAATADLGQPGVQVLGPADADVRTVAVGTGAITPVTHILDAYDPDMLVCTDDGVDYCLDGMLAADAGVPLAVVNHATSEVDAIAALADHLDGALDVPVHHVEQGCMYEFVTA